MRVALPIHGERISPVFDVAGHFVLLDVNPGHEVTRREVRIGERDPIAKTKRIVALGSHVLICGAISWPLESILFSSGVRVIPNTCGSVEDVLAAFIAGDLTDQAFLMPGCSGRRRRHRHRHRQGRRW
jgi:predicted Fe-Mo cluster-binding NifX family protein